MRIIWWWWWCIACLSRSQNPQHAPLHRPPPYPFSPSDHYLSCGVYDQIINHLVILIKESIMWWFWSNNQSSGDFHQYYWSDQDIWSVLLIIYRGSPSQYQHLDVRLHCHCCKKMVKTPFSLERRSETCGWAILLFTFTWKSEPVAVLLLHLLPPWLHLDRRALACSCCAPSRVNINVINNVISLRCVVLLQNSSKPKMTRSTSSPLSCNFLIVTLNKY